jgi:uncharacterized protein involved in exopolysaccharide biosynthesis
MNEQLNHGRLDLMSIGAIIWKKKKRLVLLFLIGSVMGYFSSYLIEPLFKTQVVLMVKDNRQPSSMSNLVNGLGGLGGVVASQFSMGGTNLDKMEALLQSKSLARSVIVKNNIENRFQDYIGFAEKPQTARDSMRSLADAANKLSGHYMAVATVPKKNLITLSIFSRDPDFAKDLADFVLTELNLRILTDLKKDSEKNIDFLTTQLGITSDPLLREKIQNLIGTEIEKEMLASGRSFDIIDPPVTPFVRMKPFRLQAAFMGGMAAFFLGVALLLWYKTLLTLAKSIMAAANSV